MNGAKKSRLKFNVIDFLILLIVIGVLLAFVIRSSMVRSFFSDSEEKGDSIKEKTIGYTVKISDIQQESFELIDVGSKLYSYNDNSCIGTIKSKKFENASMYIVLENGDVKKTYLPNRIDVYLDVETKGTIDKDKGYLIEGIRSIVPGDKISCCVDKLYFNVEVRDAFEKGEK